MSHKSVERISCPKCGAPQDFTIWTSLNVTINPEEKQRLLQGTLTEHRCSACGNAAQVVYSLLYHDMQQAYLVWLVPPSPNGQPGEMPAGTDFAFGRHYKMRVVESLNQLREKILIFDAGLDDRVIEVAKLMAKAQWQSTHAGQESEFFFSGLSQEGEEVTMNLVILAGESRSGASVTHGIYAHLLKEFSERLKAPVPRWARIDQEFALQFLDESRAPGKPAAPAQPAQPKKSWWPFGRK